VVLRVNGLDLQMTKKPKKTTKKKTSSKKNLGKYKSALEKSCAKELNKAKIPFDYESICFELAPSFKFSNRYMKMTQKKKDLTDRTNSTQFPITYTPDFVGRDQRFIIETKGYIPSHHDFPMRWKIFLRHIMDNDLGYDVYLCKSTRQVIQAIEDIKKNHQDEKRNK